MAAFSTLSFSIFLFLLGVSYGQLSPDFYRESCPLALATIRAAVRQAVSQERRMGASLLRLHFHDCFVNGCDGSLLLDDNSTFKGEKTALPNLNSVRGFEVMDTIKSQLEHLCPGVVSCADIVAVAARDSVVALGGPTWIVPLGRRDSLTANFSGANSDIPAPTSSLAALTSAFAKKDLNVTDLVALSGAHTIGQARCTNFRARIYTETNINSAYAASLRNKCPRVSGDDNLSPLEVQTSTIFDNAYFQNLVNFEGLLHSDQQLFNNGSTDSLVQRYKTNPIGFFADFASAMVKMGNISPLTGSAGEIRTNCRKTNGN